MVTIIKKLLLDVTIKITKLLVIVVAIHSNTIDVLQKSLSSNFMHLLYSIDFLSLYFIILHYLQ